MPVTDSYGRHEVLHTAHIMSSMFDEHILQHGALGTSDAVTKAANAASEALAEFYQVCGREFND